MADGSASDPGPPTLVSSVRRALVVIAASTGGIAALSELLAALPASFPVPIAIVHHRPSQVPSHLGEILQRQTRLRVQEARARVVPARGTVYVAPPERRLVVETNGTLGLVGGRRSHQVPCSASPLFGSAAAVFGPGVVAVVLTGSGMDATDGVHDVKAHGGLVIAEHPETARFPSMPLSAIATGDVDLILPLDAIAPALRRLVLPSGA